MISFQYPPNDFAAVGPLLSDAARRALELALNVGSVDGDSVPRSWLRIPENVPYPAEDFREWEKKVRDHLDYLSGFGRSIDAILIGEDLPVPMLDMPKGYFESPAGSIIRLNYYPDHNMMKVLVGSWFISTLEFSCERTWSLRLDAEGIDEASAKEELWESGYLRPNGQGLFLSDAVAEHPDLLPPIDPVRAAIIGRYMALHPFGQAPAKSGPEYQRVLGRAFGRTAKPGKSGGGAL
jgi:hypothetical protein